jgi:dolichol-phosphate mannosyltransferase
VAGPYARDASYMTSSHAGIREVDEAPILTVIVPVFNEAATIEELLERVLAAPYDKQIIVVDDGSTDGTSEILAARHRTIPLCMCLHERNQGKGSAIRTGLEKACGRFVIIQDGDLETDPEDYPLLIEPLLDGRADFVIGSRFRKDCAGLSQIRPGFRLGVHLLNFVVWQLYGVRLSDEACCYKAMATKLLKAMELRCEGFEFCPEVVAKASRMKLRIMEVEIKYCPRSAAAGKKIRYWDGLRALWWLWKLRRWRPENGIMRELHNAALL